MKIYLTLNTVVLPSELPDALELARQAYRCGVDAFIVQDIGISIELSRIMPDVEVHVSTQMNIHDEDGLRAAAALGATRVTLARELSLDEIARLHELAEELGVELESFAHGALCICYSGQCFMSSLVGGRSANRGRCAQACLCRMSCTIVPCARPSMLQVSICFPRKICARQTLFLSSCRRAWLR